MGCSDLQRRFGVFSNHYLVSQSSSFQHVEAGYMRADLQQIGDGPQRHDDRDDGQEDGGWAVDGDESGLERLPYHSLFVLCRYLPAVQAHQLLLPSHMPYLSLDKWMPGMMINKDCLKEKREVRVGHF